MSGFTRFFAGRRVLLFWDHRLLGTPKIRVGMSAPIGLWYRFPQGATGRFAAISEGRGDHLPSLSAQGDPDPRLLGLLEDKGPQFIQFENGCLLIGAIRLDQRFAQGWQLADGFFSHPITEDRDTPNVRSRPRKLLRSS